MIASCIIRYGFNKNCRGSICFLSVEVRGQNLELPSKSGWSRPVYLVKLIFLKNTAISYCMFTNSSWF